MVESKATASTNPTDLLDGAIDRAVDMGRREAESLRAQVQGTLATLEAASTSFEAGVGAPIVACASCGKKNRVAVRGIARTPTCGYCHAPIDVLKASRSAAVEVVAGLINTTQTGRGRINDVFQRQAEALTSFNIVMFGRTGAGKSSLIEAFSRGVGETVSPGNSDWTTDVRPVQWRSCRLFDTPGISGWGRTVSSNELEERARRSAEVADVVVLAFDSQSQQASEFEKIAAWVAEFGKPVIAILNCRNARWRMPPKVADGSARSQLSQAVREHATNIRDELGKIGLHETPIIALHTKRALFGRASEPFGGPDAKAFATQRSQFGVERLSSWSNFPALESLLIAALREDAVGLRIGMLREQVRALVVDVAADLGRREDEAVTTRKELEAFIDAGLKCVGYPPRGERTARDVFRDEQTSKSDLLTELEVLRGEPFSAPAIGELGSYAEHLIAALLMPLRTAALGRAEEVILSSFDQGKEVSAKEFESRVIEGPKIKKAAEEVVRDSQAFLVQKIKLQARDLHTDLRCLIEQLQAIDGRAGTGWRRVGNASSVGGILTGAAAVIAPFVLVNSWNPGGWAMAGIAVGAMLVGWLFDWGGRKAREKAERERLRARAEAMASARRAVHETFEHMQREIRDQVTGLGRNAVAELLIEPVRLAALCRKIEAASKKARSSLTKVASTIPAREAPARLFARAARSVEGARFPGDPAASKLVWLGEDWVADPEGLVHEARRPDPARSRAYDPSWFDRMTERFRGLFLRSTSGVSPGDGSAWLSECTHVLTSDRVGIAVVDLLEGVLRRGKPRIYLCGDYSAGKSSFIKRLLMDAGQSVPETLRVRADPTTSAVVEYEWEGVILVDTPGFQSGREGHDDTTFASMPDASAVIYLFQPNLVTGRAAGMDALLRGDDARGIMPKLGRTLFVIHRSDDLGADPEESPDEYERLCRSKVEELVAALGSRDILVDRDRIFCMASDPFGLVGDRLDVNAATLDPYRRWDGFGPFRAALRASRSSLLHAGVDISVLEGGIARFTALAVGLAAEDAELERQSAALRRVARAIDGAKSEGAVMAASCSSEMERVAEDHACAVMNDVLAANKEEEINARAQRLAKWWEEPTFKGEVERWQSKAADDIEAWRKRSLDQVSRVLESIEFRTAFPSVDASFASERLKSGQPSKAGQVAEKGSKVFGGATREVVLQAGHALGFKFAPWGAVKLASKLRVAGGALGALGVVISIYQFVKALKAEGGREAARREAATFVRSSCAEIVGKLTVAEADQPGPVGYLMKCTEQLDGVSKGLSSQIEAIEQARGALNDRRGRYQALLASARRRIRPQDVRSEEAAG